MNSIYSPRKANIEGALREVFQREIASITKKLQLEFEERFRVELAALAVLVADSLQIRIDKNPQAAGDYLEIKVQILETKPIAERPK